MNKAIFFDIDETLTTTISGETFKQNSQDIKLFEGVEKGCRFLKSKGYELFGISNQGGVAANHKSIDSAIEEMQNTYNLVSGLELIAFCPDYEGNLVYEIYGSEWRDFQRNLLIDRSASIPNTLLFDSFRKPSPGMIQKLASDYKLDLSQSWMIGDRPEDKEAAQNAGIKFMWADKWRSRFTNGVNTFKNVTPEELEFLEGIKV